MEVKNSVDAIDGYNMCVNKYKTNNKIIYKFFKRISDVLLSSIGLIVLLPVMLVVALIIKIDSKGPIFFIQKRMGLNGKMFKLYKFRTMKLNADKELRKILENNEDARIEYEENKKLENDPRITKIGKLIRKLSIDELPQLINILKGDMTLIGPRPYLYREKKEMKRYYEKIITVKPGLTGLWQVSGRNNVSFKARLELDEKYIENQSMKGDIKIFFLTFVILFKKEGAK